MKVRKITSGFVVQEYDTELREWVSQKFVASDVSSSEWEGEDGEYIDQYYSVGLGYRCSSGNLDVEVNDIVYSWDQYWEILNDE